MTDQQILELAREYGALDAGDWRGLVLWQKHPDGGLIAFARALMSPNRANELASRALIRRANPNSTHGVPAIPAPLGYVHKDWSPQQGQGRIFGHCPGPDYVPVIAGVTARCICDGSRTSGCPTCGVEGSRGGQQAWTDPEKEPRFQPGEET